MNKIFYQFTYLSQQRAFHLELFNVKGDAKRGNIFRELVLLCFLKISISLKKSCTIVCSEITFSTNSFHIEANQSIDRFANQLTGFNMVRFLLKGVS